jgi:predicted DNA-binding ribbon-helix-helix protein
MKSSVVKHSVVIAGRRTSVSLEDEFWKELKKIARHRKMTASALITEIKANQQHDNPLLSHSPVRAWRLPRSERKHFARRGRR